MIMLRYEFTYYVSCTVLYRTLRYVDYCAVLFYVVMLATVLY